MDSMKKAFMAGIAGTAVMTAFFFISEYLNFPRFDFLGMFSSRFHTGNLIAWVLYFAGGVFFAYIYGMFSKKLPAHSWMRGMIYALILWGGTGMILMPFMGMGFFWSSFTVAVGALIAMMLYGTVVGYLYEH